VSIGAVLTGGAGGRAAATDAVVISPGVNGVGFTLPPQDDPPAVVVVVVVVVVVDVDVSVLLVVELDVDVSDVVGVEVVAGFNGSCGVLTLEVVFGGVDIFGGIFTVVPAHIILPSLYLACSVNFGLAARIAWTVVLFSFAIEDKVSPLSTSTMIAAGFAGGFSPAL
jgi:hypothetical protein